jgi:iron complex outermembrane receptor protein
VGELPRLKYQAGALYYVERVQDAAQAFNTVRFNDAAGSTYSSSRSITTRRSSSAPAM